MHSIFVMAGWDISNAPCGSIFTIAHAKTFHVQGNLIKFNQASCTDRVACFTCTPARPQLSTRNPNLVSGSTPGCKYLACCRGSHTCTCTLCFTCLIQISFNKSNIYRTSHICQKVRQFWSGSGGIRPRNNGTELDPKNSVYSFTWCVENRKLTACSDCNKLFYILPWTIHLCAMWVQQHDNWTVINQTTYTLLHSKPLLVASPTG